ncbi:MAG TPA: hypothetical protein VIH17_14275 [Candidatus Acidoferrales bacterium]
MRTLSPVFAILIFTCGAAAPAAQTTQPTAKQAKKVWTNEDLERLRPGWRLERPAPAQPEEQPAGTVKRDPFRPQATATPQAPPARAEAERKIEEENQIQPTVTPKPPDRRTQADYWQKQIVPLQAELAQVEGQISRIQRARVTAEGISNAVNLLDHSSRLSPENQLQLLEQRRAELLGKISDLEDEARRANIPHGWLR